MSRWGDNIIRLRKARGIGQVALAKKAGIDKSTLNRIETRDTYTPQLEKLLNIAAALDVDVEELFIGPGPENGSGRERKGSSAGGGTRIEDRLGDLLAYIKTLEGRARSDFIRAIVALLTAIEHARPAASSGTASDDER